MDGYITYKGKKLYYDAKFKSVDGYVTCEKILIWDTATDEFVEESEELVEEILFQYVNSEKHQCGAW